MQLTKLTQRPSGEIFLEWGDGHSGPVALENLREACPCAGCKGETVLLHHYAPPPRDTGSPGRYLLHEVTPVGNYGLKVAWQDGHAEGIYTWDYLRSLCECADCVRARTITEAG